MNTLRLPSVLTALLVSLLVIIPAQAQQPKREGPKLPPDIANEHYGPHERNVLDLWKAKSDKPTPLVVYIHGGGFRAGSKESINSATLTGLLDKGISVMAINYHFSPAER